MMRRPETTPRALLLFLRAALLAIALVALPAVASAQDEESDPEADSAWAELDRLDPEDFKVEEIIGHYSRGWFPQMYRAASILGYTKLVYADVHDRGENLRSAGFVPTTAPFSWREPFDGDEREILKPRSDEEEDDGYPITEYNEYGIKGMLNLPMPAALRGSLALHITRGMLFSHDTTRSYLALSGIKRPLKEVGVVSLRQYSLAAAAGLQIPIYGVFVQSEMATIASYYYLYVGGSASYAVANRGTQYVQIANPKDELRFSNGSDTATLQDRITFVGLNRFRTAIDVAVGWNFAADVGTFALEAFFSVPTSTVLADADWRQYYAGLRIAIGYQWLPKNRR